MLLLGAFWDIHFDATCNVMTGAGVNMAFQLTMQDGRCADMKHFLLFSFCLVVLPSNKGLITCLAITPLYLTHRVNYFTFPTYLLVIVNHLGS